jgi:hypothetical protein
MTVIEYLKSRGYDDAFLDDKELVAREQARISSIVLQSPNSRGYRQNELAFHAFVLAALHLHAGGFGDEEVTADVQP